jgi:hypothetical protein
MRIFLGIEKGFKNLTRPTTLHFLFPVLANITTAIGSVNKPAELTCLKFPGRALFLGLWGTLFYNPARLSVFLISLYSGKQEKHLPLHMWGYISPTLLVAVNSFCRYT